MPQPLDEFDQISRLWSLKVSSRKKRIDDNDVTDFLNWRLTPTLLLIASFLLLLRIYFSGDMVQCWTPKEFSKEWEAYAERLCWTKSTYFVPLDEPLPESQQERSDKRLSYYQWTPFFLAMEAVMFYFPHFVWLTLRHFSGLRIKALVKAATDASNQGIEERQKGVAALARHILISLGHDLKSKFDINKDLRFVRKGVWARPGWYVCALYIVVKLLYLLNIFCQFLILQSFLDTKYSLYGIQILRDLVQGKEWTETGHFPRVTMCDFEVRALGQPRKYSLQCVLVINLFNEKIFIFLWFWFAFVGILTIISLLTWLMWCVLPMWRKRGVEKCLEDNEDFDTYNETFLNDVLRPDGQFLLKMIGVNVGEPIMFDIANAMWEELTPHPEPRPIDLPSKADESSRPVDEDYERSDMKKRPSGESTDGTED